MGTKNSTVLAAVLLIISGAVHALPQVLTPLVSSVGVGAITLQVVVGVVSVIVGLYLLLESK